MARPRREPERTCVGCRVKAPKRDLVRLVTGDEGVRVDPGGKAPGRGAYVHRDPECIRLALRRGALAYALRTRLSPEEAGNLTETLREI
ncbi:MAG: YlxR family protein [Actinomycetota bacterium]|nr:YlxR family protein [Actinomycetota bacterium]